MPRRKKPSKSVLSEERPRLQLPAGDEGKMLTSDERKQKVALFLDDYDAEGMFLSHVIICTRAYKSIHAK